MYFNRNYPKTIFVIITILASDCDPYYTYMSAERDCRSILPLYYNIIYLLQLEKFGYMRQLFSLEWHIIFLGCKIARNVSRRTSIDYRFQNTDCVLDGYYFSSAVLLYSRFLRNHSFLWSNTCFKFKIKNLKLFVDATRLWSKHRFTYGSDS